MDNIFAIKVSIESVREQLGNGLLGVIVHESVLIELKENHIQNDVVYYSPEEVKDYMLMPKMKDSEFLIVAI